MKLRFDRFELKPTFRSSCLDDYVEVLDGKSRYSGTKGKFCGYTKPEDIRSSGRYMWVLFRADDSTNAVYEGFKATFTAEDQPSSKLKHLIIVYDFLIFIFQEVFQFDLKGTVLLSSHLQSSTITIDSEES